MIRKMSVSGSFYPSKPEIIRELIKEFNRNSKENRVNSNIVGAIVPHAGYIYSGFTANEVYRILPKKERFIVIGPSHRFAYEGISGSFFNEYQTPLGNLKIDLDYLKELAKIFDIEFYPIAHQEHSTEVQMPFIKYYFKTSSVIEFIYSKYDYRELSKIISYLLKDSDNMIIISSDLSHFYPLEVANRLDSICMRAILDKNILEMEKGCEACGKIGIKAILKSANELSLKSQIISYTTSADRTSDETSVVGYLGAIIEK